MRTLALPAAKPAPATPWAGRIFEPGDMPPGIP